MKLKVLKLHKVVVLNNSQMKAVRGTDGTCPYLGDGVYDGGYLPEVVITCSTMPTTQGSTGICWAWCNVVKLCIFTGYTTDTC